MNKTDELKDKIVRNLRDQIAILKKIIKSRGEQITIQKEKIETLEKLVEKLTDIEGIGYWKPKNNIK